MKEDLERPRVTCGSNLDCPVPLLDEDAGEPAEDWPEVKLNPGDPCPVLRLEHVEAHLALTVRIPLDRSHVQRSFVGDGERLEDVRTRPSADGSRDAQRALDLLARRTLPWPRHGATRQLLDNREG